MDLKATIRSVPDFPQPGILFYDITTLLKNGAALRHTIDQLVEIYKDQQIDVVVGMESRGFIFGMPLAYLLGVGFVPVRKPGKLPAAKLSESYSLEYGTNTLELHEDAIEPGQRVLIVDDLLATGGTAEATCRLVERVGGKIASVAFIIELTFLQGRTKLAGYDVVSLLKYDD